ncbi:MAG: hypothetical protein C5B55_12050 [Blastocatellia bacterium]|nr:MAG: hypothetical protein C5B55_12050 [Blastocatellia bacterium]
MDFPKLTAMLTLLITSVLLLSILAVAFYFWQKSSNDAQQHELPPPNPQGLFEPTVATERMKPAPQLDGYSEVLQSAKEGDKTTLLEARQINPKIYNDVLDTLVKNAPSAPNLLSLVSYVTRHELPVNATLANAFIDSWRQAPDRVNTGKMLHIAALTDDASAYRTAAELVLSFWREKKIPDLQANELQALLTGEFWVLSSGTRSSGAGFLLKRTLASARRELEATTN